MGRARVPARREGVLEANGVFSVLDQGRLWASGTTDREDAIPPSAATDDAIGSMDASDSILMSRLNDLTLSLRSPLAQPQLPWPGGCLCYRIWVVARRGLAPVRLWPIC